MRDKELWEEQSQRKRTARKKMEGVKQLLQITVQIKTKKQIF